MESWQYNKWCALPLEKWRLLTYEPVFLTMYHYLSTIRKLLTAPDCWLVSDYYITLGSWLILIISPLSSYLKKDLFTMIIFLVLSASRGSFVVFLQILMLCNSFARRLKLSSSTNGCDGSYVLRNDTCYHLKCFTCSIMAGWPLLWTLSQQCSNQLGIVTVIIDDKYNVF